MKITVQYTGQLRLTIGIGEEVLELPDGSSLQSLSSKLSQQYPEQSKLLHAGEGFPSDIQVFVNSVQVQPSAELNDGDEILLLSPISGG